MPFNPSGNPFFALVPYFSSHKPILVDPVGLVKSSLIQDKTERQIVMDDRSFFNYKWSKFYNPADCLYARRLDPAREFRFPRG